MTPSCHILADDLTGALDCATAFADGHEVPVALGSPAQLPSRARIEVCAIASRALAIPALHARLAASIDWLGQAQLRFKKVDSLLRGNTFAELAWLASSKRFRQLVLAPAFPAQGRCVRGGRLLVSGTAAGEGVTTLSLRNALQQLGMSPRPGGGRFGTTDIAIPDANCDADLDAVVAAFAPPCEDVLWCGSAGLAQALARAHGFATSPARPVGRPSASKVLIATGSRHPVLRAQLAHLSAHASATNAAASCARWPGFHVEDFGSAGIHLPKDQAEGALAAGAAVVVAAHATTAPDMLVAIGGDSLLALCEAAGATALSAGVSPRPGWGSARLLGGRWDGLRCLSRSGAFGDADDLSALLASLGSTPASAPHDASFETSLTP